MQDNTAKEDASHSLHPINDSYVIIIIIIAFKIFYSQALNHNFLFIWINLADYLKAVVYPEDFNCSCFLVCITSWFFATT